MAVRPIFVAFTMADFSATQNNGQVMSVDDARQSGANIAYSYDALKRLTKATTAGWTQNIGYDGFGNITSKDVPSGSAEPTFPGAVSNKNWLAGVGYDLNGNALAVNAFQLNYDAENRLATATSGSAVESYSYDESNRRVEKSLGSSDYLYFYGQNGRLLSIRAVSSSGVTSVVADRIYFGGLLLGSAGTMGSQDVSTLTDRLGTAATGYPYGTDKGNPPGNDQPDFATYTKDATTGFEYANQRYYSAGLGRFLTTDPLGRSARLGNPRSWNRYSYADGDPVNGRDPSGRECITLDDGSVADDMTGGGCSDAGVDTVVNSDFSISFSIVPDTVDVSAEGGSVPGDDNGLSTPIGCRAVAASYNEPAAVRAASNLSQGSSLYQLGAMLKEAGQFFNWLSGASAGQTLTFGTTSIQSQQLVNSQAVAAALNGFLTSGTLAEGSGSFGAPGFVASSSNATMQFVGGFKYAMFVNQGNVHIVIYNATGMESFSRYATAVGQPPLPNINGQMPMGTNYQTYDVSVSCTADMGTSAP